MQNRITSQTAFLLLYAIFIGGFSSLSLELIVLRQLSNFVGTTTITVSIVMGAFLAFMSLGYYKGSVIKIKHRSLRKQAVKGFLLISLLIILASTYVFVDMYFLIFNVINIKSNIAQTIVYSLIFLSFGPYFFGKITAMLSRYLHHRNPNYTGKIMAIDTIGSVCGSLFTTLLIMPFIGVNHTITVVVVITLSAAYFLSRKRLGLVIASIGMILFSLFFNQNYLLKEVFGIVENNAVTTISVHEIDDKKSRLLMINGSLSSKISQEHDLRFSYANFILDNFIDTIPQNEIKDILIVGAGGFTLGLDDFRNNYTYVDIDKNLKRISEEYFLQRKLDKNKKFVVQDANQFLKESTQKYDIIVLDTYSSDFYIPMELVTKEYFQRAKNNLKENGILLLNSIAGPNFSDDFAMNLDNTLRQVFPHNLHSQITRNFNAWAKNEKRNIIYVYYNHPNPKEVYTINKNPSFIDFEIQR